MCRSRGIACALAAAINYIFGFMSKISYYSLETTLSLPGISLLYAFIYGAGLILVYFILPETEGRTLEDIELHFADNSKKITDHKIAKLSNFNKSIPDNFESSDSVFELKASAEQRV